MESVISAIVGVLMLFGIGAVSSSFYYSVKKKAVVRVYQGLAPLSPFTKKLTGSKAH